MMNVCIPTRTRSILTGMSHSRRVDEENHSRKVSSALDVGFASDSILLKQVCGLWWPACYRSCVSKGGEILLRIKRRCLRWSSQMVSQAIQSHLSVSLCLGKIEFLLWDEIA